jgi:ABC-type branched-subunit amino acid transport system ATPase component
MLQVNELNQYYGAAHTLRGVSLDVQKGRVLAAGPQRRGQDHAAEMPDGRAAGGPGNVSSKATTSPN